MLATLVSSLPAVAQTEPGAGRVVEIRAYTLKRGTRDRFHQLVVQQSLPMLERWKVDVVAYGPSLHDADSYFLLRAYASTDERQRSEDAFYGSEEWKTGPREAILACIESYSTIVITVDDATLRGLRRAGRKEASVSEGTRGASGADLATLTALNQDYIRSVQTSDVRRFREILSDDFLCSLPDGSLLNREQFLEQTTRPVTISNLQAEDVNVRLMGDFAIIHARTTYQTADGRPASGRYTDVWARRDGRWVAISAHVTRN